MCLQDLAIARRLMSRPATAGPGVGEWSMPANPIRHSVVVAATDSFISVVAVIDGVSTTIFTTQNQAYNGFAATDLRTTVILRAADYGQLLCAPLVIYNNQSAAGFAPQEVFPDAPLDLLVQGALRS